MGAGSGPRGSSWTGFGMPLGATRYERGATGEGFEPPTWWLEATCSIQLSYPASSLPFWRSAGGTGETQAGKAERRRDSRNPADVVGSAVQFVDPTMCELARCSEFAVLHTYRWRVRNDALA